MNDHDDDLELRAAFRRWRSHDAAAAPRFPGIPERRRKRKALARVLWIPASVGAAAALFLLLSIPAPPQPSLTEILPRPLLAPSTGETVFLTGRPVQTRATPSDFLRPGGKASATSIF